MTLRDTLSDVERASYEAFGLLVYGEYGEYVHLVFAHAHRVGSFGRLLVWKRLADWIFTPRSDCCGEAIFGAAAI